jgi:hypothetical protein
LIFGRGEALGSAGEGIVSRQSVGGGDRRLPASGTGIGQVFLSRARI